MKINSTDPDIETIFYRIRDNTIDLQPDFQRDFIWNRNKKQCLIDTILRNWQMPPIFLVESKDGETQEVLDGQQRLTTIYNFLNDDFPVDGHIEPENPDLIELNGLLFSELPSNIKAKFKRFSLTTYTLFDYNQSEPYELFFRLNQGAALTPAEKRNTLFGLVREQVSKCVQYMQKLGINNTMIGFNNHRLSYHDVVARLLYIVTNKSMNKKVRDADLVEMYRSEQQLPESIIERTKQTLERLSNSLNTRVKLNKASLLTWLLFIYFENRIGEETFYISFFEEKRLMHKKSSGEEEPFLPPLVDNGYDYNSQSGYKGHEKIVESILLDIYQNKVSSSVNDANPVKLRLFCLFGIAIINNFNIHSEHGERAKRIINEWPYLYPNNEELLIELIENENWGTL